MTDYPARLAETLADLDTITDRVERAETLIEIADRFDAVRVPAGVAQKPYPEVNKAPACESEAYVWALDRPDGTLDYYFDVLNPQGLSAMAMGVLLAEAYNGAPLEQVLALDDGLVFRLFGREISMGKGAGLMGIIALVRHAARQRLEQGGRSSG
jgi:cysteine desulfuration protein SufE